MEGHVVVGFSWDDEVDAAYLSLEAAGQEARSVRQVVVEQGLVGFEVILDVGADGRLLGVELIGAEAALGAGFRERLRPGAAPSGT